MSTKKQIREIQKIARDIYPDAVVEHTKGTHLVVSITGPEGTRKVFCSSTAGDHREIKNTKRDLRKAAREVGLIANCNDKKSPTD